MRILYVIGSLELGGAEQHLLRVARELAKRGWRPEVFALTTGGALSSTFVEAGVPIYGATLPSWIVKLLRTDRAVSWARFFLSMAMLWLLYWRKRPDATHFFLPSAYIVGGIASIFGPPMRRLMSRRSLNHYQLKNRLFTKVEFLLHRRMDVACGNSKAVMVQLREEGFPASKLRLVYNGIELLPQFPTGHRDETRAALGVPADALVMSIVANLIPYKGHADLVDALALVAADLPQGWCLLCIGRDDGIGNSLRQRAAEAGIADNILWLGSRRDVPEILAASDIGLLVSHQEGFSNAVLECMAAELPMVVTDVGGNAEAVVDGCTGYVVPAHDPQAMAVAIRRVVFDPERRLMGQRGRDRIQQLFTLDACVDAYERMYEEALAQINIA